MWSKLVGLRTAVRLILMAGLVVVGWSTCQALHRDDGQRLRDAVDWPNA